MDESMVHRVRAAGVLVENGRVLLVQDGLLATGKPYWIPPGGGLEPSDHSVAACVKREVWEETGLRVEVGAPVFIKEFADMEAQVHHVELFFRVTRRDDDGGDVETATPDRPSRWFTAAELHDKVVFPPEITAFLADKDVGGCRYLGRSDG